MTNIKEATQQEIKVFVTMPEGEVRTVAARVSETIQALLERAFDGRLPEEEVFFFVEEDEEPVALTLTVEASGLKHRGQAHCARNRRIEVKVRYNGQPATRDFPASAKVRSVERWAEDQFQIPPADRAELVLRLCGSEAEENGDVRISKLADQGKVCFDLGPKQRVQG